jgi:nickel/cobalt exporter
MVSDGTAVLSIRHVERHWSGFSPFAHRNPYMPAALIVLGLYTRYPLGHQPMPAERTEPPNEGKKIQPLPKQI